MINEKFGILIYQHQQNINLPDILVIEIVIKSWIKIDNGMFDMNRYEMCGFLENRNISSIKKSLISADVVIIA